MEKTKLLYLNNSYQKTATASVLKISEENNQWQVFLDQTIFYPQGGGQPADIGTIKGPNGFLKITHVSYNNGKVLHKGKIIGEITEKEQVKLLIDWNLRYQYMQLHTAGHILDQAIKNIAPKVIALSGCHGINNQNYLEIPKKLTIEQLKKIEAECQYIINQALPITTEMVTKKEIEKRNIHVPFKLPENKPLRIMSIGDYPAMPDGGTQLKNTQECNPIKLKGLSQKNNTYFLSYYLNKPQPNKPKPETTQNTSTFKELQSKIQQFKIMFDNEPELDQKKLNTKYLGKKGLFNELSKQIRNVSPQERKQAGKLLNALKNSLQTKLGSLQQDKTENWVDLTLPGILPPQGHLHPISQAIEEISEIFKKIGFTRVRYPETDWDYYAFEALNMPLDHPARDEWETFFVDLPADKKMGKIVLTPHTSNGQVREMERLKSKPPIRMVNIARCYRRQQDVTHTQMFHQFEGLVVDQGINIQHLKGTLDYFAKEFYGPGTKSRIRPFHFQFTEPSFEVDFSCHLCHGTGLIGKEKCSFCKSGWHEVGGAGMVHPNVLKAGGIDPNKYTGFAFGWGVERTYTLKEGLNIDDIRLLYSGDMRFLEQF
ncbi:MAG: phenylalanine--tRNA ligase subunit alpha [Candidatus Paceibacterota bacterium]